jgi:Cys-tRNA(Pro)/Cys-tRNA(Cys) deacylase
MGPSTVYNPLKPRNICERRQGLPSPVELTFGNDGTAMSKTTRATQTLDKLGVKFTLHTYDYDPDAESIGLQAAESLGVEASRVLKTLMAEVDGKPVCAVVPSDCEVSMKKLAGAFGGKAAKMMRPADAERLTGYHVGGISPFGQKKRVPVAIEETALGHASVFLNGGQRGLQVELAPGDAVKAADAIARPLTA